MLFIVCEIREVKLGFFCERVEGSFIYWGLFIIFFDLVLLCYVFRFRIVFKLYFI